MGSIGCDHRSMHIFLDQVDKLLAHLSRWECTAGNDECGMLSDIDGNKTWPSDYFPNARPEITRLVKFRRIAKRMLIRFEYMLSQDTACQNIRFAPTASGIFMSVITSFRVK
jgi:hypothetical protein